MAYIERLRHLPISRSGDRAPRFPCDVEVEVLRAGARTSIMCRASNISRSGLLLDIGKSPWPGWPQGDELVVKLSPDDKYVGEPMELSAKVTRLVRSEDASVRQVAVRFLELKK